MNAVIQVARALRAFAFGVSDPIIGLFGRMNALFPAVRRVVAGEQAANDRHAIYVHYDPRGAVHGYVLHALRELAGNGYAVTFVSNAPSLRDDQIKPLLPFVREVVHRRNSGYDFAAWRDGLARLPGGIERLILANDSVYGPLFPLARTLEAAERSDVDMFGITDSLQVYYHLQSYFLLFFPGAIRSPAFRRFWARFPTVGAKPWLVRNGEVGLSRKMARAGLRLGALCPYAGVAGKFIEVRETDGDGGPEERAFAARLRDRIAAGRPANPMHVFFAILIADWDCPFLKRELIRSNPLGVPGADRWEALLTQKTGYDPALVRDHLRSEDRDVR
jgi:hypothetical protein